MTALLWASLGLSVGAAILYASLALRRPIALTYLAFCGMMALLAVFLYFELVVARATRIDEAVTAMRWQVFAAIGFCACTLAFIPAYAGVRPPRLLMIALVAVLVAFFVVNVVTPNGLWFSGRPTLVRATMLGQHYTTVVARPLSVLQLVYASYMIALQLTALALAGVLFRRGMTQRATALALSLVLIIVTNGADIVRDLRGGAWPYVGQLGLVALGLIMSIQLAREFRMKTESLADAIGEVSRQAGQLTAILGALRTLEDSMLASVARLEAGMACLRASTGDTADLARLGRAVTRLRDVSRAMSPA